jgi:hypothetical protein
MQALPPVRKSVIVPLVPSDAFSLFLRRLPEWWPLSTRSVSLENAASCHVEPRVGGRLYERTRDGEQHTWGRFVLFDDGTRAVFTWHPGHSEEQATEVEVRFIPVGASTRVDVEHRDWERLGERASFIRASWHDSKRSHAATRTCPLSTGRGASRLRKLSTTCRVITRPSMRDDTSG